MIKTSFWKSSTKTTTQVFIIILLFILTRLIIIFFGSSQFFCESELYRGTVAQEIFTHGEWPLLAYQNEAHTGGSLIVSLLIIPFFALFPHNLITIKIVALIFSVLTLYGVYYFTCYCLNKPETALLTLLWFVFAPPLYLMYSTVLMGEHYESQLFGFLSFILFYKMTDPRISNQKRLLRTVLFGLTCGFSLYFSYTFLITFITCLLVWFLLDKKFILRRSFIFFVLSAILGFIPSLLYHYIFKFFPWTVHGQSVFHHIHMDYSVLIERLRFLFTFYWPHGLWEGDLGNVETSPWKGVLLGVLFMIAFLAACIEKKRAITDHNRLLENRGWFLILLYPIVFIVLNMMTDFHNEFLTFSSEAYAFIDDYTEFKYVFVLFPFVFIFISSFLTNLCLSEQRHFFIKFFVPVLVCIFFWSMSMLDVAKLTAINNFDLHIRRWRPNSYHLMGEHVFRFLPQSSLEQKIAYIEKIKMPYRKFAYVGFGYQLADEDVDPPLLTKAFALVTKDCQRHFVIGLGAACAEHIIFEGSSLGEACPFARDIPTVFYQDFIEGLGVGMGADIQGTSDVDLSEGDLPAYYKGLAVGKLRLFRYNLDKVLGDMEDIPVLYRNDFYTGLNHYSDYLIDFDIDRQKLNRLLKRI